MRIFVTGAAGRLGKPLVEQLARDHQVTAFDLREPHPDTPANVRWVQGDLRDRERLEAAAGNIDAAIHLGAIPGRAPHIPPSELFEINVQGTCNTFEAAASGGAGIVIYASSLCAIGLPDGVDDHALEYFPIDEAHPCRPRHTYDLTKMIGEQIAAAFTRRTGTPTICFRFPLLAHALHDGWFRERVETDPPPLVMLDYLDFADAIRAIEMGLSRRDLVNEVFFLQASTSASRVPTLKHVRRFYPAVPWRGGLLTDTSPLINAAKARDVLGFEPRITWQQSDP